MQPLNFNKLDYIALLKALLPFLYSILGGLLGCWLMLMCTEQSRLGVVNITGIINQFVKTQAQLNLPPDQLKARVQSFGHKLETSLQAIATEKQVVLLPREAVIAGAKDYTPLLQNYLAHSSVN